MTNIVENFLLSKTGAKTICLKVTCQREFEDLSKKCYLAGIKWKKSKLHLRDWSPYVEGSKSNGDCMYITLHKGSVNVATLSSDKDMVLRKYGNIVDYPKDGFAKSSKEHCSLKSDSKEVYKYKKQEDKKMSKFSNILGSALDFGVYKGNNIALSMYGISFKNKDGVMISYNKADNSLVDVDSFTFDIKNSIFKMPTRIDMLVEGDYVLYNDVPYIVKSVRGSDIAGINMKTQANSSIKYANNVFGFNFVTKLITLFDMNGNQNNMGNMLLPLLLSKDDGDNDMLSMMVLSGAMSGNMSNPQSMFSNPMMMMMMDKGDSSDDLFKTMMMMNMFSGNQNPLMNMFSGQNVVNNDAAVSTPKKEKEVVKKAGRKPKSKQVSETISEPVLDVEDKDIATE